MNIFKTTAVKNVLLLIALAAAAYAFRAPLQNLWEQANIRYRPCQQPISYSIGNIDKRFGISRDDFLKTIGQAAQIWENPVNKKLFAYSDKGSLTINLVYDYRQAATEKLRSLGISIHDDQNTYNILQAKYNSLQDSYNAQKAGLEAMISGYQAEKSSYDAEVALWNSRGGVSPTEYNKLEQERTDLNAKAADINQAQKNLNDSIDSINAVAAVLNKLVAELNIGAAKYNSIGSQLGDQFSEGEYVSGAGSGGEINIYQFDDKGKLVRVLAHELGHALGLGHLDNPKAIMYRLNESMNEKLTADDIAALKNLCGIK